MICRILAIFTILFFPLFFFAGEVKEETKKEEAPDVAAKEDKKDDEKDEKKVGFIAFPIAFYSSDTSAGFGASAVIHKEHYKDKYTKKIART